MKNNSQTKTETFQKRGFHIPNFILYQHKTDLDSKLASIRSQIKNQEP